MRGSAAAAPGTATATKPCSWVSTTSRSAARGTKSNRPRGPSEATCGTSKANGKSRLQAAGVEPTAKAGCEAKRFVREFRTDGETHGLEVGQKLGVGHMAEIGFVDVIGTSKGRGTAGVMKRHNFSGQRASHGVKRVHRHGGSIGMSADPSRVLKGTRMSGRYGNSRITVRNLKVVRVDEENNMLLVKGAIPGPNGGYVMIRKTNKH